MGNELLQCYLKIRLNIFTTCIHKTEINLLLYTLPGQAKLFCFLFDKKEEERKTPFLICLSLASARYNQTSSYMELCLSLLFV